MYSCFFRGFAFPAGIIVSLSVEVHSTSDNSSKSINPIGDIFFFFFCLVETGLNLSCEFNSLEDNIESMVFFRLSMVSTGVLVTLALLAIVTS